MPRDPGFYRVRDPGQIKAFTDPLRLRILQILKSQSATNQQLANALGLPPARIFHHVRVLSDLGLIRLVDSRVTGGNVEKYYRAVARGFLLYPDEDPDADTTLGVIDAFLEQTRQEILAGGVDEPEHHVDMIGRSAALDRGRLHDFTERLLALLAEFWEEPEQESDEPPRLNFRAVIYRNPEKEGIEDSPPQPRGPRDE